MGYRVPPPPPVALEYIPPPVSLQGLGRLEPPSPWPRQARPDLREPTDEEITIAVRFATSDEAFDAWIGEDTRETFWEWCLERAQWPGGWDTRLGPRGVAYRVPLSASQLRAQAQARLHTLSAYLDRQLLNTMPPGAKRWTVQEVIAEREDIERLVVAAARLEALPPPDSAIYPPASWKPLPTGTSSTGPR